MITQTNKDITIMTKCTLIGLNRSSYYLVPKVKEFDEKLIDEIVRFKKRYQLMVIGELQKNSKIWGLMLGGKMLRN